MTGYDDQPLIEALRALREEPVEPPPGFEERLEEHLRRELRWRVPARRIVHDRRVRYGASVGGVVVAVAAIALVLRRQSKRAAA